VQVTRKTVLAISGVRKSLEHDDGEIELYSVEFKKKVD
jgi:hypothetical protein